MRLLALDIGTRRTGVAYCDTDNNIPLPLDTIAHRTKEELRDAVKLLCDARAIETIVIGVPYLPSGEAGSQTKLVREYGLLIEGIGPSVVYKDERFSTPRRKMALKRNADFPLAEDDNAQAAVSILTVYLGY